MKRLGLRARATVVATLLSAALLTTGAALLVITLDQHLTAASDELSRSRVRDLLDQAASGQLPAVLRNVNDDAVAQVVAADGTVLASSANIEGAGPVVPAGATVDGERRTISAPDDRETERYRVWVQTGPGASGQVTVVEGSSLESVHEATATLRRTLVLGLPVTLAALALVTWLVLGRALARLDRIRAEVDAVGPDQLERRIAGEERPDEVGRLAATMNRMLARLDDSAQRQRHLVADVSHDLRAPLASQRVSLELALASPGSADLDLLRRDVLGATSEMERLIDDLLVLAVADEGATGATSAVDLDVVALEEASRARVAGGPAIDTTRVSAGPVRGDPSELRRIVRNLIDNAATHAASRVELRLASGEGVVRLDVVDDGPGVPEHQREAIFERFRRADLARTRGAPGIGLGLAIARSLAERAGGGVELVDGGPGAWFRLTLPLLSER
jgi:signal transduction histidine kinase